MNFPNLKPQFQFTVVFSLLAVAVASQAQETDLPYVPPPSDLGAMDPLPSPDEAGPSIPDLPQVPPTWTWQRTTTNSSGTVSNTHQGMTSDDESQQLRQHVVENPRGEMVQSWERSQTEDGYLYRRAQTFTAPDGTLLRQHEQSLSGTDPYNYTRQHEMTLRDGRTILQSQTRSWDGTSGTMERTFTGPNGQTREFQRPWTPDDLASGEGDAASLPMSSVPRVDGVETVSPPLVQPPENKRRGWMGKMNPFREGGFFRPNKTSSLGSSASPGRSGFTLGSGGRSHTDHVPPGLSWKQPGEPSPKSSRPAWAGPSSSPSPPHHTGMAFPTKPGQGRKR